MDQLTHAIWTLNQVLQKFKDDKMHSQSKLPLLPRHDGDVKERPQSGVVRGGGGAKLSSVSVIRVDTEFLNEQYLNWCPKRIEEIRSISVEYRRTAPLQTSTQQTASLTPLYPPSMDDATCHFIRQQQRQQNRTDPICINPTNISVTVRGEVKQDGSILLKQDDIHVFIISGGSIDGTTGGVLITRTQYLLISKQCSIWK